MSVTVWHLNDEDIGKTISLHLPGGTFTGELTGVSHVSRGTVVMEFSDKKKVITGETTLFTKAGDFCGV